MKLKTYLIFILLIAFASCAKEYVSPTGKGGSMARFTIAGNFLYVVDDQSLKIIDIGDTQDPIYKKDINIGFGIETIFPYSDKLFIGSQRGLYIYDIKQAGEPEYLSNFAHVLSCDPVVVNYPYAYVTLRMTSTCRIGFNTNQLDILDISDFKSPKLIRSYPMAEPHGLAVDGNNLFICQGNEGLGIYNVQNPDSITKFTKISGIEAYDVILDKDRIVVIGSSGLFQYNYANLKEIKFLSKINVGE